jgi:hypothetical protein
MFNKSKDFLISRVTIKVSKNTLHLLLYSCHTDTGLEASIKVQYSEGSGFSPNPCVIQITPITALTENNFAAFSKSSHISTLLTTKKPVILKWICLAIPVLQNVYLNKCTAWIFWQHKHMQLGNGYKNACNLLFCFVNWSSLPGALASLRCLYLFIVYNITKCFMSQLQHLYTGFSLQRPRFRARAVHVEFMVNRMATHTFSLNILASTVNNYVKLFACNITFYRNQNRKHYY